MEPNIDLKLVNRISTRSKLIGCKMHHYTLISRGGFYLVLTRRAHRFILIVRTRNNKYPSTGRCCARYPLALVIVAVIGGLLYEYHRPPIPSIITHHTLTLLHHPTALNNAIRIGALQFILIHSYTIKNVSSDHDQRCTIVMATTVT